VTATLPYILIFAFLIRAVTLEGSYDGIVRYILPEWGQLITFRVRSVLFKARHKVPPVYTAANASILLIKGA